MVIPFFFLNEFKKTFISLFLAALGLCCCMWALGAVSKGYSLVTLHGLLVVVASLLEEHGLQGTWAQYLWLTGLVALQHVGVSWTRDGTHIPCTGSQIPHH